MISILPKDLTRSFFVYFLVQFSEAKNRIYENYSYKKERFYFN